MPSELEAIQRRFYELVTEGGTVEAIDPIFVGTAGLSAAARMQIYANMYLARLIDVLGEQFPDLRAAVGDGWDDLARAYLAAHPSTSPSLRELGQHLPGHLLEARPELVGIAELEWTRLDLFDGPDTAALGLEDFQGLDPDALAAVRLELVPTARLVGDGRRLVFRVDCGVHDRALDEDEAAALASVAAGTSVGGLCELLGDAGTAFGYITRWIPAGLLRA